MSEACAAARITVPPPRRGRAACAVPAAALAAAVALAAQPAAAGDPSAGRGKARQCQTCHGIDGLARIPEAPHIAGESELYLRNQLEAFRSGRREHPIMSVIAKGLSDADIADLAAWYSSIRISVEVPQ
jgi:cytochrome c553